VKRGYSVPMKLVAAALAAVAALGVSAAAGAHSTSSFCTGAQLHATFNVVRGSAGAGNIVYRISLTNISHTECSLTGTPSVRLFGKTGKALPTHVMPSFRPGLTAILVRVAPGKGAHATARFSPDVPGAGEPVLGRQCEPKAYMLRIYAPSAGVVKALVRPATPVCEHGTLQMSVYGYGR
jgi:hypothetical protein